MAKKKAPANRSAPAVKGPAAVAKGPFPPAARPSRSLFSPAAIRETIESVAIAFVLAFLFRTFVAEAFVIPTGSMAPTLMGQHKDLLCPQCGYRYQAGASSESEDRPQRNGRPVEVREVVAVTCPMCRYTDSVDPRTAQGREKPTFGGDRILATKFAYELGEPRRWDVMIFKYPGDAQTNYIKRLVGLPRETVRIWHGDIYIKPDGQDRFRIERRSPAKVRAMAQIVYDNDYLVDAMTAKGWPLRWQRWPPAQGAAPSAWTASDGGRAYEVDGSAADVQWLRYRHFVPTLDDWDRIKDGRLPEDYQPQPQLITDFYAYNTSVQRGSFTRDQPAILGLHWVGDLFLECQLDVAQPVGKALFDLVKGGQHFGCELDCATGEARLSIEGRGDYHPTAQTAVRGKGSHRVDFANIDEQLLLWIDGSAVPFDSPTSYERLANDDPRSGPLDPLDLAPAGVGSQSSSLRVGHLRLRRDIYYTAAREGFVADYPQTGIVPGLNYQELVKFWSTPSLWKPAVGKSPFDQRHEIIFPLEADQFFTLGDNSPQSQDARLWAGEKYVSRGLLVGKALYIFWPHSFDTLPGTNIPFPFFPNFARMGFIR
jgi:signal peptidase I